MVDLKVHIKSLINRFGSPATITYAEDNVFDVLTGTEQQNNSTYSIPKALVLTRQFTTNKALDNLFGEGTTKVIFVKTDLPSTQFNNCEIQIESQTYRISSMEIYPSYDIICLSLKGFVE